MTDRTEIDRVFALQRAARWTRKVSTADDRRERLTRLRSAVVSRAEEVVTALHEDLRRPAAEAAGERDALVADIDHAMRNLDEWMAPTEVDATFPGTTASIRYEARGNVLLFGPWNFPFALTLQPLIYVIAAGNTAIVKPNELAPATSTSLATIIGDVFTEDEVAVVEGDVELAEQLLELPFDHIFFTGSPAVARTVMASAARHLASVTLELGGKCPAIVDGTTDLAKVAATLAAGKLSNAGQICLSPDHVYVHSDARDEFVQKYLAAVDTMVYRDGEFEETAMGRMVNRRNFDRVCGYIDDALERGATLLGTGRRDADTLSIEPVVLLDVPLTATVMQDEIFGPVLPVFGYDDLAEVLEVLQARAKPLALWAYTDDPDTTARLLDGTSAGGTTINGWATHVAEPNLPFGGVGQSGMGAYHGVFGFRELSHARSIVVHHEA